MFAPPEFWECSDSQRRRPGRHQCTTTSADSNVDSLPQGLGIEYLLIASKALLSPHPLLVESPKDCFILHFDAVFSG